MSTTPLPRTVDVTGLSEEAIVTVEKLVVLLKQNGSSAIDWSYPGWKARFDAYLEEVKKQANDYPPGFVADDSRESIYEGCGE